MLGNFKCIINVHYPSPPQCFLNSAFSHAPPHSFWPPQLENCHKADLAQAYYTEEEIIDLAVNWPILYSKCLHWGHKRITCLAQVICIKCSPLITRPLNAHEKEIPRTLIRPNLLIVRFLIIMPDLLLPKLNLVVPSSHANLPSDAMHVASMDT